jgi:hypothetical protein
MVGADVVGSGMIGAGVAAGVVTAGSVCVNRKETSNEHVLDMNSVDSESIKQAE